MRKAGTMLGGALLAAISIGGSAMANTLSDLRWEKRVVILFSADDKILQRQVGELRRDEAGMADRDMVVFAVVGAALRPVYGPVPSDETAATLRHRFGIDAGSGFTAVLIGKDGREKWRASSPVPHTEIDAIIDAMPMRRSGD